MLAAIKKAFLGPPTSTWEVVDDGTWGNWDDAGEVNWDNPSGVHSWIVLPMPQPKQRSVLAQDHAYWLHRQVERLVDDGFIEEAIGLQQQRSEVALESRWLRALDFQGADPDDYPRALGEDVCS